MRQIWAENLRNEMNVAIVFIYRMTVKEKTFLKLSSDVSFRVCVNGNLVGYGPRRKAHGKAAVNVYSLDEYIGKTVAVAVECVSYRVNNFYIVNQQPFFAAEIVVNGETVADSLDFEAYINKGRLRKVQRFSYQRGFIEAYRLGENDLLPIGVDEKYCCEIGESCAPYPTFNEVGAEPYESGKVFKKTLFTEYDDAYLNRRNAGGYKRAEQEYRITLENDAYGFEKTDSEGEILSGTYRCYKLNRNACGFIAFDAEVIEDANLMINYDELLSPLKYENSEKFRSDSTENKSVSTDRTETFIGGATNIDVYRLHSISLVNYKLKKGRYSLLTFEPDEMRYIRFYVISGAVKLTNVRLITYENSKVKAEFSCEDEQLELLFKAAVNTFAPNAVDILTDCPSRERAGWLCDSYFTGRAETILTGSNAVEKNTLETFYDYRQEFCKCVPKGVLPMCYPCDHVVEGRFIPNWCMWFILELESYLERTGDAEFVKGFKNKVDDFINYELKFLNDEYLLEDIDGWVFVEWSRANDLTGGVNFPTNMLFSKALKAAYALYGNEKYAEIAAEMDKAIIERSYNGKFFVDNAVRNECGELILNTEWTETCQYYAFWCGYADRETYPELYSDIFGKSDSEVFERYPNMSRSNAFIGLYLRLDYLSRKGENERLVRDLKKYFLFQAEKTGTYWEYNTCGGSCCHAFAAITSEWILKAVFGIVGIDENGVTLGGKTLGLKADAKIPYKDKIFKVKSGS